MVAWMASTNERGVMCPRKKTSTCARKNTSWPNTASHSTTHINGLWTGAVASVRRKYTPVHKKEMCAEAHSCRKWTCVQPTLPNITLLNPLFITETHRPRYLVGHATSCLCPKLLFVSCCRANCHLVPPGRGMHRPAYASTATQGPSNDHTGSHCYTT